MYNSMSLNIIAAVDRSNGIGKDNGIPWTLKNDLANFRRITTQTFWPNAMNAVIMGRKTWESLPVRPLPRRLNLVVSNTLDQEDIDGALCCPSLNAAIAAARNVPVVEDIFVIGGASLYREALTHPSLGVIYMTTIDEVYDCDVHFPTFDPTAYTMVCDVDSEEGGTHLTHRIYMKNPPDDGNGPTPYLCADLDQDAPEWDTFSDA